MLRIFRSSTKTSGAKIFVWALLGLLAVGLVGFNVTDVATGVGTRNVARVGDQEISRVAYTRSLENGVTRLSQRFGVGLTMSQAVAFGLDRQVLAQLVTSAALDGEAEALGISVSDETVRDEVLQRPEFRSGEGFSPDSYRFALERSGFTVPEFEETVRSDIARVLLEAGISGGVVPPTLMAETLLSRERERRDFSYIRLTTGDLEAEIEAPSETQLRTYYEGRPDAYRSPETRRVSYVALTPREAAEGLDIAPARIEAAYEASGDRFRVPERRMVDRIVFGTAEEAETARRMIDEGESLFEGVAGARGLDMAAVQLGEVAPRDLDASAREAVFGVDGPGLVGPVTTDLGPALFRVNAILAARETPVTDALETLRDELARLDAEDVIDAEIEPVEDLLAGGATLEEVGAETGLAFGTAEVRTGATGLAADEAFRAAAEAAEVGDLPVLFELSGGGIAALRVEGIDPPARLPFEDVAEEVEADWRADARQRALADRAEALMSGLTDGRTLDALAEAEGLGLATASGRTRTDVPPGLEAEVIAEVFGIEAEGGVALVDGGTAQTIVRLDGVTPFDPAAEPDAVAERQDLIGADIAYTLLESYAAMAQAEAGVRVNEDLLRQILARYP